MRPSLQRLLRRVRAVEGWQGIQPADGGSSIVVLFKAPVPDEIARLDGGTFEGVPTRVVPVRYSAADQRTAMRRIPLGDRPTDVNSMGTCADGAGISAGIAEPPGDTRSLEQELSEQAGVRVFVERFAGIMPA